MRSAQRGKGDCLREPLLPAAVEASLTLALAAKVNPPSSLTETNTWAALFVASLRVSSQATAPGGAELARR